MKFLTCLRPRPLDRSNSACGLRHPALALCTRKRWVQAVRVRPLGRYLGPRQVPKNFMGPLRGRAGFGVKIRIKGSCVVPMRKFSQATEFEGEAFRTV
jgi:hypothetical protein